MPFNHRVHQGSTSGTQGSPLQDSSDLLLAGIPDASPDQALAASTDNLSGDDIMATPPASLFATSDSTAATSAGSGDIATSNSWTSPFVINLTYDSSTGSAPAAFFTAMTAAVDYLESEFANPVTINVNVGWGEVNNVGLSSNDLGGSWYNLDSVSYSALRTDLTNEATTPTAIAAAASLPSSAPTSGAFYVTRADAKALGLAGASTSEDGAVGFSSSLPFTYDDSSGVASGSYDFFGVAVHELTEVMGRMLLTGEDLNIFSPVSYNVLDLMHYSAPGVRDYSASTPGYFSVNSGTTDLGDFNTTAGGDAGDWASSMGDDSFDAFSNSGVVNAVSSDDLKIVNAIGWQRVTSTGAAACYAAGTRIAVPGGERAVERLAIGDLVVTAAGETKAVKWLGRRAYTASQAAANPHIRPILIRQDAIAPGLPRRDLLVSPMHGLLVDGLLVPAVALVNGASIHRPDRPAPIAYVHVELDAHDIILAEGLAAETFVDDDSRQMFDNADEYADLYGADARRSGFSRPRLEEGFDLERLRHRIARRAGLTEPTAVPGALHGHVERLEHGVLHGWAFDSANPATPVELEVLVAGTRVAHAIANRYRIDLDAHGLAVGRAGFTVALPLPATDLAQVFVRRITDHYPVPISQDALTEA
jgi:hypothetical protein